MSNLNVKKLKIDSIDNLNKNLDKSPIKEINLNEEEFTNKDNFNFQKINDLELQLNSMDIVINNLKTLNEFSDMNNLESQLQITSTIAENSFRLKKK